MGLAEFCGRSFVMGLAGEIIERQRPGRAFHHFVERNRSALAMTEKELRLIAAPAMMALGSGPECLDVKSTQSRGQPVPVRRQ